MICNACGIEAPTRRVTFYHNIGAIVVRFSKVINGNLCKRCIHRYFWECTTITLFLGWWGVISLIFTPVFILNNVGRYLFCLGMEPPQKGAQPPELTEQAVERLRPYAEQLIDRLGQKEPLSQVANDIACVADVTSGQVCLYIHALRQAAWNQ